MKQISRLLSFAAAAAMCFSACSPEELKNGEVNVSKFVTVHFGTENTDPASTKATLTPNEGETAFQAAWENEDKISIEYLSPEDNTDIITGTWDATNERFSANLPNETGTWYYQAAYPVPSAYDNSVDFGPNRTQKGNAYNSKYDIMIGSAGAENAAAGKDETGKDIVFKMTRQTAIAYFHFTSDLDEAVTSATLTVSGNGAAIASTSASVLNFAWNPIEDCKSITITFPEVAPNAQDFQLWFNVLPTIYESMTLTVETATKTFTISRSTIGEYVKGKLYKVKKSGIAWTDKPTIIYFHESFDSTNGTGGNDGKWSGSIASSSVIYDNTGWDVSNAGGANQCLKLGTGSKKGSATTPALGIDSKSASLYFKAGAWDSKDENTTINLSVSGPGSISPASVNLVNGEWSEYECTITGADETTKLKFEAVTTSNNRFFIDEVYVYSGPKPASITLYTVSMAPVEGGTLSATPSKAIAGAEVTLTAEPEEGYIFNDDWAVKDANEVAVSVNKGKFTMPAANVTVSGSFIKKNYSITKTESGRGSIVAKKGDVEVETAQFGDEITLVATPNEGYELKSWTVEDSEGTVIDVVDNKFTMPASDVTITATFRSTTSYTVSFSVNGNVTTESYKESEKIVFPDVPAQDGVQFVGWVNSDFSGIVSTKPELVDVNTAVMGTTDIFYYAVFGAIETAVFDPTDISATPEQSSTSWKHTATGVTLELSAGQRYISNTPNTFTVTKGASNYFQISSDKNYIISEIETKLSTTDYKINNVSTGATVSTSGTTQTVKSDNLTSIKCYATSSYQIRATRITVTALSGYSTKIITLNEVAVSGTPTKTEYTVDEAFDPTGLTVTGTYSNGESVEIADGISWECSPTTFAASGNQTVIVTATVKSIKSAAYDVNVTVNTIRNTLKATDKSINVNSNLDVSTLFTSNSNAEVRYTLVENPSNAGTLSGSNFLASAAGTYKVKAIQAETAKYSAAEATATITVGGETKYFVKVTSAPADWSGEYLVVYEAGNVAFDGSRTTLDAESNTVSVTIDNSKIEATDALLQSTFTINADGTTIKSKSGYYIGQTSNANGLASSTSTSYTNTLSITDKGDFTAVSGGAYLRYNSASNQLRFRYYKSTSYTGQKAIQLYKLAN